MGGEVINLTCTLIFHLIAGLLVDKYLTWKIS